MARTQLKLFAHQDTSLKFLKRRPRVLDLSDPGTGKTAVHILDFASRRKARGGCALVIATKSLLYAAWANDTYRFAPGIKVSVATATNREAAFAEDADIYVTNHDAAKWLAGKPKKFFAKFDTLIIDEGTAYKHATSQRSKAIAKIAKYFEYRRLLTGTPTSNSITDIWHQALLIDDGQRLGTSFFAFRSAVCQPEQVGPKANMIKWVDKDGSEAAVSGLLSDIVIRHKLEECVDLPPNHEYAVPVQLGKKILTSYKQMEQMQIMWLKDQPQVTAINAAVAKNKLLQIASGAVYNDEGDYTLIDTERYELAADLAEARTHTVVFYLWQHQRDEMLREFSKRGMSCTLVDGSVNDNARRIAVQGFQAGAFRVLLAHPQAAGHGLTLTRGVATIWCGPTYNLEHYLQGKRRVERIGQTQKTETIVLTATGTIDELAWERMQGKRERQDSFLNMVAA